MDEGRRVFFKEIETPGKDVTPQELAANIAAAQSGYSKSVAAKKKVLV